MGDANGKESQYKDDGNKKQELIHDTTPSNAKRASFFRRRRCNGLARRLHRRRGGRARR